MSAVTLIGIVARVLMHAHGARDLRTFWRDLPLVPLRDVLLMLQWLAVRSVRTSSARGAGAGRGDGDEGGKYAQHGSRRGAGSFRWSMRSWPADALRPGSTQGVGVK